jgi:YhhN family
MVSSWSGGVVRADLPRPQTQHFALGRPALCAIASRCGRALQRVALPSAAFGPAALGAALFLVSDLTLANQLFNGRTLPLVGDVIWLTYGPGQALIVASVAAALQVAHLSA